MKNIRESSPAELALWIKNLKPFVKDGFSIAKSHAKNVVNGIKNKTFTKKQAAEIIANTIKNDPTLFGDFIRAAELSRQTLSGFVLFNLPPLPTIDTDGIVNILKSLKTFATYSSQKTVRQAPQGSGALKRAYYGFTNLWRKDPKIEKSVADNVKRTIENPGKTAKNYVLDRATYGTYKDSGVINYSSPIIGLNPEGAYVDNSVFSVMAKNRGLDFPKIASVGANYYKTLGRHYYDLAKKGYENAVSKMRQFGNHKNPSLKNPLYATNG